MRTPRDQDPGAPRTVYDRSASVAAAVLGLALSMVALFSCGDPLDPQQEVSRLEAVSGSGQEGAVATTLPDSLVVLALAENGEPVSGATVSWTVSAGAVDRPTTRTDSLGRAAMTWTLGEAAGRQTAVATAGGDVSVEFVTRAHPAAPTSLVVEPAELRLDALGASERLHVTATDAYGNSVPAAVEWSVSDPEVARVNAEGWVVAMGNGATHVVARVGEHADTTRVQVEQVPSRLLVDPAEVVLHGVGTKRRVAAGVADRLGTLIDGAGGSMTWSLSNPDVAQIDAAGTLTALRDGQVTVIAASDTLTGHALATITTASSATRSWSLATSVTDATLGLGGTSADDILLVASTGEAFRYDGTVLHREETGVATTLSDVWLSSTGEAFAVGADPDTSYHGLVLHHEGYSWNEMSLPTAANDLHAVWGAGPQAVWAVGNVGDILHYDGSAWTQQVDNLDNTRGFSDVWGRSATDVFAVLTEAVLHYDGAEWTRLHTGFDGTFYSVWGTSSGETYVVGYGPDASGASGTLMLRFDGVRWSRVDAVSGLDGRLVAVGGAGPESIYVAGFSSDSSGQMEGFLLYFDGSTWSRVGAVEDTPMQFLDIWSGSSSEVFLSGRQGAFARALGPDLTIINHDSWPLLMDLWGASNSEIFGVGSNGAILHYDGAGWSEMESGTTSDLSAVWGTGPEMVLAAGASGTLIRFDGASWEELPSPGGGDITALWGLAQDDFFAAFQSGPIARYDGTEWRTTAVVPPEGIDPPSEIGAMYGFGPQTVFAVGWTEGSGGEQPALMRYDGTAWDVFVHSGYGRLHDVWGSSPTDMYAVGEDRGDNGRPLLLHFDGVELTSVDLPVDSDSWHHPLEAVWGTGPSDVYAAGEDGLMLHYDGTEWTVLPSVTTRRVSSLWGTATGPVWAVARGVGGTGSLLVGRSP